MSNQTQAIFDAAMTLPETERLRLVERLLESLPPGNAQSPDDELFAAELDQRWLDFQANPSTAASWSQIRRQD